MINGLQYTLLVYLTNTFGFYCTVLHFVLISQHHKCYDVDSATTSLPPSDRKDDAFWSLHLQSLWEVVSMNSWFISSKQHSIPDVNSQWHIFRCVYTLPDV